MDELTQTRWLSFCYNSDSPKMNSATRQNSSFLHLLRMPFRCQDQLKAVKYYAVEALELRVCADGGPPCSTSSLKTGSSHSATGAPVRCWMRTRSRPPSHILDETHCFVKYHSAFLISQLCDTSIPRLSIHLFVTRTSISALKDIPIPSMHLEE